jgi:TPR repeat protein
MTLEPFYDDSLWTIIELIQTEPDKGLQELQKLAETGHPTATLSYALQLGEMPGSEEEELKWLMRASKLGFIDATWNLAMIANQKGDIISVKKWIDCSIKQGSEDAMKVRNLDYDIDKYISIFL